MGEGKIVAMQLSETNQHTLMIAINQAVEEYATACANDLIKGRTVELIYPPNGGLTAEETTALLSLRGNEVMQTALRKVLADCAAGVVFDLLNLIDGTTDPKHGEWSGVRLVDAPATDDERRDLLHDEFFAEYWAWREIKPDQSWHLDLLAE